MPTLKTLIDSIVKSDENEVWPDIDDFSSVLNLSVCGYSPEFNQDVKGYFIYHWLCTDTHVGTACYFLNDELVAVSQQDARKSDKNIFFVSKEAADKMRSYILSLEGKESIVPLCNMEQEIDNVGYIVKASV